RILVGLIPSLEKSGDEAANLGKIVVASLKGMMGATLGNTVEGSWENAIGSKQTRSASSFMTVFDEVGYYTAPGMAVMAAQARSLGFSLIFAAQDLPSMEKRIKQEAQSILANCNLKIFGKLEDPGDTQTFFKNHVGDGFVLETNGMAARTDTISGLFMNKPFYDNYGSTGPVLRVRACYDHLRNQREGEVHMFFAEWLVRARMFYAVADRVQALRVHKMLPLPPSLPTTVKRERAITEVAARLNDPDWKAASIGGEAKVSPELARLAKGFALAGEQASAVQASMIAVGGLPEVVTEAPRLFEDEPATSGASAPKQEAPAKASKPVTWGASDTDEDEAETAAPSQQPAAASGASSAGTSSAARGYMPRDMDTDVVPRVEVEDANADVTKLKLPEDITAYIEKMASKFNKGLGGESSKGNE
ncbi:MAG: TraM recognition domain-containing protein, partial [Bdellovibrionales bacterium]